MKSPVFIFAAGLLAASCAFAQQTTATPAAASTVAPSPTAPAKPSPLLLSSAPIKNFRLPTFNKEGKRVTFLKAGEALVISTTRVDVKDMLLTLFTDDGSGAIDSMLLSPSATVLSDKQFVHGNESVRLIRADLEVTGEQWSFSYPEKRVLIENNARVTFQEELKDIIK